MEPEEKFAWVGVGLFVCLIVFFLVKGQMERQEWLDAHCEVMGKTSSSTGVATTVNSSGGVGVGSVYIPGKTGYKCDDGMEYWE